MSCKLEMMCQKLSGKILLPIQKPSKINPSVSSKSPQVIVVHAMQCCDHTDPNNLLRFSVFCLLIVRHTYLLVRSTNIITTKQCDTMLNFRTVYTVLQQPLCRSSIFFTEQKKSVVMVLKRYHSRLTRRLFLLFWALVLSICCLLLRCCG